MKDNWENHWKNLNKNKSILGKIYKFNRKKLIAGLIANSFKKYFPKEGIFVDAGCGTSQTSIKINKDGKILVGIDLSYNILKEARNYLNYTINADIFKLPFKNKSIDGIWNAGVMEHFTLEEINQILNEFKRVLKKKGICLLFWPAVYGPVNITTKALEFILNKILRRNYKFFPDEVSQLKSKKWISKIILKHFKNCRVYWPLKGGLIYHLVICYK